MCKPKTPKIPEPQEAPRPADANATAARLREQERLRRMRGFSSTILTSSRGLLSGSNTAGRTLLGE